MTFAEILSDPAEGWLSPCAVCGQTRCAHVPGLVRGIDSHPPTPEGPLTTPAKLGHLRGIFVREDGSIQDGSEDGRLLLGPHDPLTLDQARRLGLVPEPAAPASAEPRAIHGPLEDRRKRLREDRRRGPR